MLRGAQTLTQPAADTQCTTETLAVSAGSAAVIGILTIALLLSRRTINP